MTRKVLVVLSLFSLLCNANSFSQNSEIDSLKQELLNVKHDTSYNKICIEIGDLYEKVSFDSAILYYSKAVVSSDRYLQTGASKKSKADISKQKALSLRYIGIIYLYKGEFDKTIEYLQKSLTIYEEIGNRKGISNCLNNLGSTFLYKGSYDKSIEYYEKSLKINNEQSDEQGISMCYLNMAIVYKSKGDYPNAISYNEKAFKIFEKLNDQKGIALYYNSVGIIYRTQGDYEKAIDCYIKSLKIKEAMNDRIGITQTLCNIGNIYFDHQIYDKALEYYTKSAKIDEEMGNKKGLALIYINIGDIYSAKKDKNKALEYYFKSLAISEEIANKEGVTESLINIGNSYRALGDYTNSNIYLQKALSVAIEIGEKSYIAYSYDGLANLNVKLAESALPKSDLKLNYLKKAIDFGSKSLALANEMNILPQQNAAAQTLMKAYDLLGNSDKALQYADLYITTKDSIFNADKTKALADAEAKYQNEKKQKEIELLERDKIISNERAQKQRVIIFSISAGLVLLVFMVTFILRRLQITRKQKRIIEEKNILLNEKNEEILAQSEEIAAQRDNLELMNIEVTLQRDQIAHQHEDITASISYASRIQQAMLPPHEIVAKHYPESFVMYRPCQIVSGDFYWFKQFKNIMYIAAVDCTGHGVPGAFMSMLGLSLLNETIGPRDVNPPHEALNEIRKRLKKTLHQTGIRGEQQDGMDMALCMIDLETNIVQFAGAYNPLYLVRNNEMIVYKGDRMPIGVHPKDNESFKTKEIHLQPNDSFYIFSDGYVSQTGGVEYKKFKSSRFQEVLLKIKDKPMTEQKQILESTFDEWKGHHEQVDDILIVGVKIK